MPDRLHITYQLTPVAGQSIEGLCRGIALEQTVEMAEDLVRSDEIREQIIGETLELEPLPDLSGSYRAVIAFRPETTAYALPQLLNLLYGNISIKNNIRITAIEMPGSLLAHWPGPNYGIEGIRRLTGVRDRALAMTALKPMGMPAADLALMAGAFAQGEGDIVKDDHGLADHPFCGFAERVERCQEAVARANQSTGHTTLYFPNISAPLETLEEHLQLAVELGVKGVLVAPFLLGLDTVRYLASRYDLVFAGHPAFSGTHFHDRRHGMTPGVLLGTLFRLIGCDISIYPNFGGRFAFTPEECHGINAALQQPLGELRPAFPAPAGGMTLDRIPEMAAAYGSDAVYLIGSALLREDIDLVVATRRFMARIHESFAPVTGVRPCRTGSGGGT